MIKKVLQLNVYIQLKILPMKREAEIPGVTLVTN
jgi:hypothetical protein